MPRWHRLIVASQRTAIVIEPASGPRDGTLAGQVGIVTGGGKGLGRAIALQLAARGAAIVVNNS